MNSVTTALKIFWVKNNFLIICAFIVFSFTVYHRLDNINFWTLPRYVPCDSIPYENKLNRFSGIVDRQAGVPDIIHFVRFGEDASCFKQGHVDTFLSIFENYEPKQIYIHTDRVDSVKTAISKIFSKNELKRIIEVKYYPVPNTIFGLNISEEYGKKHAVDFTKLKVLRRYGGIFLGSNIHVVQNPVKFLQFEMTVVVRSTMNIDSPIELFEDVLVAHRDARFLEIWLKSYHSYDAGEEKHVQGSVMRALLKQKSMFVHILENDLSKSVILNSEEYKATLASRKRYFINIKNEDARCL